MDHADAVDVAAPPTAPAPSRRHGEDELTPAERARRAKIAENQEMLRRSLASEMEVLQTAVQKKREADGELDEFGNPKVRRSAHKRRAVGILASEETSSNARRRSGRISGDVSNLVQGLGDDFDESSVTALGMKASLEKSEAAALSGGLLDEDGGVLMECAEYWAARGVTPQYVSNGHYTGWVNPELQAALGLASSAAEAWNDNGGGKFSYATPGGEAKGGRGKTKSSAKEFARSQFRKNPNCYFYRHRAPGVAQHMGDWTEEEHDLFIETAKKFGCGDKWGLFSTYIPHRVGYQCSNYYRQVILREGSIVDSTYMMSAAGHAVYVGERMGTVMTKAVDVTEEADVPDGGASVPADGAAEAPAGTIEAPAVPTVPAPAV